MKPVYNSIALVAGAKNYGIWKMLLVPREWVLSGPIINFNTGAVSTALILAPGRTWLELEMAPTSHDFECKPKSNKGGDYFEISFSGLLNDMNAASLQVINTIRQSQVVMIVYDRQKQKRIVGNQDAGMVLQYGEKSSNGLNNTDVRQLDFLMESEDPAPYYTA